MVPILKMATDLIVRSLCRLPSRPCWHEICLNRILKGPHSAALMKKILQSQNIFQRKSGELDFLASPFWWWFSCENLRNGVDYLFEKTHNFRLSNVGPDIVMDFSGFSLILYLTIGSCSNFKFWSNDFQGFWRCFPHSPIQKRLMINLKFLPRDVHGFYNEFFAHSLREKRSLVVFRKELGCVPLKIGASPFKWHTGRRPADPWYPHSIPQS